MSKKKKKGLLAIIWESLTKTGGCCGSGESCCGGEQREKDIEQEQRDIEQEQRDAQQDREDGINYEKRYTSKE